MQYGRWESPSLKHNNIICYNKDQKYKTSHHSNGDIFSVKGF